MQREHIQTIHHELGLTIAQIEAVAQLLAEDATIPFIARYRKEATGSPAPAVLMARAVHIHA